MALDPTDWRLNPIRMLLFHFRCWSQVIDSLGYQHLLFDLATTPSAGSNNLLGQLMELRVTSLFKRSDKGYRWTSKWRDLGGTWAKKLLLPWSWGASPSQNVDAVSHLEAPRNLYYGNFMTASSCRHVGLLTPPQSLSPPWRMGLKIPSF